ncbi:hypothetical protein QBC39DRAFT_335041 [Podospora conica]|nr:hypothetical protein QBC39DRAFT_335041 [Schizothecium conicum]
MVFAALYGRHTSLLRGSLAGKSESLSGKSESISVANKRECRRTRGAVKATLSTSRGKRARPRSMYRPSVVAKHVPLKSATETRRREGAPPLSEELTEWSLRKRWRRGWAKAPGRGVWAVGAGQMNGLGRRNLAMLWRVDLVGRRDLALLLSCRDGIGGAEAKGRGSWRAAPRATGAALGEPGKCWNRRGASPPPPPSPLPSREALRGLSRLDGHSPQVLILAIILAITQSVADKPPPPSRESALPQPPTRFRRRRVSWSPYTLADSAQNRLRRPHEYLPSPATIPMCCRTARGEQGRSFLVSPFAPGASTARRVLVVDSWDFHPDHANAAISSRLPKPSLHDIPEPGRRASVPGPGGVAGHHAAPHSTLCRAAVSVRDEAVTAVDEAVFFRCLAAAAPIQFTVDQADLEVEEQFPARAVSGTLSGRSSVPTRGFCDDHGRASESGQVPRSEAVTITVARGCSRATNFRTPDDVTAHPSVVILELGDDVLDPR